MTKNEKMVNVPFRKSTDAWLERRATANGRAKAREAQAIIESVRESERKNR